MRHKTIVYSEVKIPQGGGGGVTRRVLTDMNTDGDSGSFTVNMCL